MRSSAHGCEDRIVVLEHREDHNGGRRGASDNVTGRLDAVEVGHPQVHQHDVRCELGAEFDSAVAGGGLSYDFKVFDVADDQFEPAPKCRVVVCDEYPYHGTSSAPASCRSGKAA